MRLNDTLETLRDTPRYLVSDSTYLRGITVSQTVLYYGQETVGHKHEGSDEVYTILSGTGVIYLDATEYYVVAGDTILISRGVFHKVKNIGHLGSLVFISVFNPYEGRN